MLDIKENKENIIGTTNTSVYAKLLYSRCKELFTKTNEITEHDDETLTVRTTKGKYQFIPDRDWDPNNVHEAVTIMDGRLVDIAMREYAESHNVDIRTSLPMRPITSHSGLSDL